MNITDDMVYSALSEYLGFEPDLKEGDNAERFQRMRRAILAAVESAEESK